MSAPPRSGSAIDALAAAHGDVQVMPTSFAQQRFWVLDQLDDASGAYTIPIALRLHGPLDVAALETALNVVVARHEALRTLFAVDGEQPVQVVLPALHVAIAVADLSALTPEAREREVRTHAETRRNAPFDLTVGPLIRGALLRLSVDEHVLLLELHHIVADGWSIGLLYGELEAAYGAFVAGREPALAPLPLQYPDFSVWQRRAMEGAAAKRQIAYWTERLRALPLLDLPTDRARPPVQTASGSKRELAIDAAVAEGMRRLARGADATPYVALLAAFAVLLHRYSGQTDLVIGSITSGRSRAEVESLIGLFLNTLAIRVDTEGEPTFVELLRRVRESATAALANQDVPFERVVEAVQPARDRSRSPIFQVAFQLLDGIARNLALAGITASVVAGVKDTTKFDLTLVLSAAPGGGLRAVVEYNSDLFDAGTVDRMLGHYATLLSAIVRDPATPIAHLQMLAAGEREIVTTRWNATATPLPSWTVPERVLATARGAPTAVAVRAGDDRLTYRELARRSAIVSRALAAADVRPGDRVAVGLARTTSLPVALLGILRLGAVYVPLDTAYPADRISHVLGDAGVRAVVTDATSRSSLPATGAPVLELDDDAWAATVNDTDAFDAPSIDPATLAYVLYTSGSTGRPKGVMIPHRALSNFLASMANRPGLHPGDALVAVTTIAFDIAGLELWLPLVTGAELVIAPRATAIDGDALRGLVDATSASRGTGRVMLQATPATWRLLIAAGWAGTPNLIMLCGGEAWPAGLGASLVGRGAELWNVYGPTETTIWSSLARVTGDQPSLGNPLANTTLYVLEPSGEPAPLGIPGELWIGGAGLATGYHGRDDLTAERFVEHAAYGRLYRTGDRVVRDADGQLRYLGRLDDQVKVRGFRIELGEIEHVLASSPSVRQSVAAVHRSVDGGEPSIVGYVVLAVGADEAAVIGDLHARAERALPDYMLPSAIVRLDALPLTPNGKVDRRALPRPASSARAPRPYVAPRTPLEAQIADVWAAVLGVDRVGVDDDFFSLGGHSLLGMRVVARLAEALPVRLTIGALFEARTVAAIAERIVVSLAVAEAQSDDGDLAALLAEVEALSDGETSARLNERDDREMSK